MAYREFYSPVDVETPDYSPIARGLSSFFGAISQGYQQRKSLTDSYKYALEYGHFESDNKFNTEYSKYVTQLGKESFRRYGAPTSELLAAEQQGLQYVADQKAQYKRFEELNKYIDKRATEDAYYDPTVDKETVQRAAFGEYGEVTFFTRRKRLEEAAQQVGNDPRSFKFRKYTSDWAKLYGEKQKVKTSENADAKSAIENRARFWDPATGKPGVTDDHAIDFLKSDERVDRHYDHELDQQLTREIEQMKAAGDADWMKGKSMAEIKNELINNPSLNTINSMEYGARKREMAKRDLSEADSILSKTSYEKKVDDRATHGLYRNDAIGYTPTFYNTQTGAGRGIGSSVAEAGGLNQLSAPGGILIISKGVTTGKPISINVEGKNAYNVASGKKSQITGRQPFNLTGYQLQVYQKDGTPLTLGATSVDELISKVQSMRPFEFKNLEPSPSIALNGYAIDRATVLGDLARNTLDLQTELGDALKRGDQTEAANIQMRLDMIEEFKTALNDPDNFSDQDIMNLAARNGITQIRQDQLVKASGSDLDWINNVTQGLNLRDKSKWSEDMRRFDQAYREAYQKAAEQGFGESPEEKFQKAVSGPKPQKAKASTPEAPDATLPSVTDQASYDALPVGAEYIGPDGKRRKKGGEQSYTTKDGKTYSVSQLKKMGYTDEKIQKAIELGNLTQ